MPSYSGSAWTAAYYELRDYRQFLAANADSIGEFKQRQQAAFDTEREQWALAGIQEADSSESQDPSTRTETEIPPGCIAIASPVSGSVWQVGVSAGQRFAVDDALLVVEAMKMEIAIAADEAGEVVEVRCAQGDSVTAGETLLVVRGV